ncbi:heavy metal sensor histidine kinase [Candidatus Nitronereus thalassa]|uniref:histidine kinase n=1 Tax=Candidatus Nitronereus thalassa TaxID=3020898 RepID=A0ABU3K3H6_9BACT|nr:heavy metal sensor histidine kinase [Candidatus Nitronereus thalassa]MDT7040933.1 heavy metal sensor histidine kinase [Candidatus Nitronereus thalassa]
MRNTSIRVRLTIWYGGGLALIMILFASALYLVMSRALQDQIDVSLEDAAVAAARSLEEHRFGPFLLLDDLAQAFPELALLDKFFQIFGPQGQITLQSANIKTQDIPLSEQAKRSALKSQATYESVRVHNEIPIRLLSYPINHGDTLVNILRVGTSLRPVEEMLDRLVFVLLIGSPLAVLVSVLGGWFLAGRALRPVDTITHTAQRIAAGDLTQRLQTTSTDEIGRLASTFNDMIARLEASIRQIRQFSADASHELRTPLTIIKGETELALRKDRQSEVYREVLESNLEEIDRMSRIVDELLFLSRADLGEIKIAKDPVQLDQLVQEIHHQAMVLGKERDINPVLGHLEPTTIVGDELRLRELLLNIVDNAIKYSQEKGTIEISLEHANGMANISVKDHGIGISPEEQTVIFNRFFRSDTARAHAQKGTGLGLAICKWIAETHQGNIRVESSPGKGSRFIISLPLHGQV